MNPLDAVLAVLAHDSYWVRTAGYAAIIGGLMLALTMFVGQDAALAIVFVLVGVYVGLSQYLMWKWDIDASGEC